MSLSEYTADGGASPKPSEETPRCLADISTPSVRRIDQRNAPGDGHEGQCPECKSVIAVPTALVKLPVRRVANIPLARLLLKAGVTQLRTRGAICYNQGHEQLWIVHVVDDALAPGWDGYTAVPVDCGPAGLQLVPVEEDDLPTGWVEGVARALTGRQDGGDGA